MSAADQLYLLGEQRGKATAPAPGATTPPLAVAPFDATAAKAHQEAWAKHLGVPVEVTNSVGMKFVLIPPGEFMRRSPKEENDEEIETRNMFGMPFPGWKPPLAKREPPQHRVHA